MNHVFEVMRMEGLLQSRCVAGVITLDVVPHGCAYGGRVVGRSWFGLSVG